MPSVYAPQRFNLAKGSTHCGCYRHKCFAAHRVYNSFVPVSVPPGINKDELRKFWDSEPCGTRYLESQDDFATHSKARYSLEPFIPGFAQFASSKGLRVLEVGVGMGADYLEWLKAGGVAIGIDISLGSIAKAERRCELAGFVPELAVSDAENLAFPDRTFDIVYSYGVMHHSSDVQRCIDEAWRVLKSGGQAKIMLYHHPSLTGFMLWLRFGLTRGKSMREAVYQNLESPGTKSFTKAEMLGMMRSFEHVRLEQVFSPGDLLLNRPSPRFRGRFYETIWSLFPRFLVRRFCRHLGLFVLITAQKPR